MRYPVILFDLDGTLIDSIPLIVLSLQHTYRRHLGLEVGEFEAISGIGTPLRAQFRRYTDDPDLIEALFRTYKVHNHTHHDAMVTAFPGIDAALSALRAAGVRLGVVTSKMRDSALQGLAIGGLTGYFETVVGLEDVDQHKPRPEPLWCALDRLGCRGLPAGASVYVGDAPFDLIAGRAAGLHTAAALWGPFSREELEAHAPDHLLRAPDAIVEALL